jgi:hypothetical protein
MDVSRVLSDLYNRQPRSALITEHTLGLEDPRKVLQHILQVLFGAPSVDVSGYCQISKEDVFAIAHTAGSEPLGVLLNNRPVDRILPKHLSETAEKAVQQAPAIFDQMEVFFTNLNLDGSWEQVDPTSGDMSEVLIVGMNRTSVVAVYWGEPLG